jgi:hypothetical protein
MSGTIRIWCLKQEVYDKVRSMWTDLPSLRRKALQMARIKAEPFLLDDGRQGFDIVINNSLIQPSHLLGEISRSLLDEGYGPDDFNIEVI